MSNKVILKRSSVGNKVPTTLDLAYGELALNYADGKIYYKTSANTVDYFSAGAGLGGESVVVYSYTGLTVDTFTGTGTQTTFTLTKPGLSTNYSLVNVQGVFQPRSSYAISGSSLIFENAPASGAIVEITLFSAQPNDPVNYNDLINKPVIPGEYTLPAASSSILGGVKAGTGIAIDLNGVISTETFSGSYLDLTDTPTIPAAYSLPTASATVLGGVKIGSGITISNGVISASASSYTLPTASATVLGGVKIGSGITISNGVISASSFSGSYTDLTNKPILFSGSYADLTNKPTLFSGSYADLTSKPTLFSGSYADLTSKPTLFSGSYLDLTNIPTLPSVVVGTTETQILTNKTLDNPTIINGYTEESTVANTGTAYTVDLANGTLQFLTLTGNCTFTFPTPIAGKSFVLVLKQDATGSRTVQFPASAIWPDGTTPTITTTANKRDKLVFSADGTIWMGSVAGQNYV